MERVLYVAVVLCCLRGDWPVGQC